MHNHQSKVKERDRQRLAIRILTRIPPEHRGFTDFDDLHDTIEELRPDGIGPVTTYDVAVRIAAFLGIEPDSLYLHAGVQEGWTALVGRTPGLKRVPRWAWPEPLRVLPADEVEDFLCTYRSIFASLGSMQ